MKKYVFLFVTMLLLLPSCKKDSWLDWKAENEAWMAKNLSNEGVQVTPTGLQYKVIFPGTDDGRHPDDIKTVTISYSAYLISGLQSGQKFEQANNVTYNVAQLIAGFSEGLKKMSENSHYILYIPASLGYGDGGQGTRGMETYIPPYSTLIFDVTLHAIN